MLGVHHRGVDDGGQPLLVGCPAGAVQHPLRLVGQEHPAPASAGPQLQPGVSLAGGHLEDRLSR